jgi:hypothetical protein
VVDLLKAEALADGGEVGVVGNGEGVGEVDGGAAADFEGGGAFDDTLVQAGEGADQLNSGAGLEAGAEGELLIDDSEDAAGFGVADDDGAVVGPQGVNGSAADGQVFAIDDIAGSGVSKGRFAPGTAGDAGLAARVALGGGALGGSGAGFGLGSRDFAERTEALAGAAAFLVDFFAGTAQAREAKASKKAVEKRTTKNDCRLFRIQTGTPCLFLPPRGEENGGNPGRGSQRVLLANLAFCNFALRGRRSQPKSATGGRRFPYVSAGLVVFTSENRRQN